MVLLNSQTLESIFSETTYSSKYRRSLGINKCMFFVLVLFSFFNDFNKSSVWPCSSSKPVPSINFKAVALSNRKTSLHRLYASPKRICQLEGAGLLTLISSLQCVFFFCSLPLMCNTKYIINEPTSLFISATDKVIVGTGLM